MGNDNGKMTYSFEIDKFSQRTTVFSTPIFSTGSCNWYVNLYPKGDMNTSKNMSLWLRVPDPLLRPLSWSRRTSFRFVIVNPSNVNSSRTLKEVDGIMVDKKTVLFEESIRIPFTSHASEEKHE
ncbi:hypothetical protein Rs2_28220 [Raphanus sativus]|nr:hypothetical protein Rs2_28220 [Raphanus sativus]